MSRLPLEGKLPDSIPEDSNLVVWYSINRDPITGRPAGPGFSGPLPRSIENAKKLSFVELSGHQLTGGVPTLPESIRMFEVHNNMMDGGIACECGVYGCAVRGGGGIGWAPMGLVGFFLRILFHKHIISISERASQSQAGMETEMNGR
jgi:hypothetical protein